MGGKGIDEPDEFGCTALHYAAYRGATVFCLLLLQNGANINAKDNSGNTPLAYSVIGEHSGCALMLLQKGANVSVDIYPNAKEFIRKKSKKNKSHVKQEGTKYKYLPRHFETKENRLEVHFPLFQGIVQNGWLGITYVALEQVIILFMSQASLYF